MERDRAFLEIEFLGFLSIALIISLGLLMTFTSLIKYSKTSIENADLNLRAEYIVNLMEKEIRQSSKVYLVNDKIVFYKKENLSIDKQGGF